MHRSISRHLQLPGAAPVREARLSCLRRRERSSKGIRSLLDDQAPFWGTLTVERRAFAAPPPLGKKARQESDRCYSTIPREITNFLGVPAYHFRRVRWPTLDSRLSMPALSPWSGFQTALSLSSGSWDWRAARSTPCAV